MTSPVSDLFSQIQESGVIFPWNSHAGDTSQGKCVPAPTSTTPTTPTSATRNAIRPPRPQKPPPPPRAHSLASALVQTPKTVVPARPPPPKVLSAQSSQEEPGPLPPKPQVPKRFFRPSMKTEYANLGDVRFPMAPKKPERSPNIPKSASTSSLADASNGPSNPDPNYEDVDLNDDDDNDDDRHIYQNMTEVMAPDKASSEVPEDAFSTSSSCESNMAQVSANSTTNSVQSQSPSPHLPSSLPESSQSEQSSPNSISHSYGKICHQSPSTKTSKDKDSTDSPVKESTATVCTQGSEPPNDPPHHQQLLVCGEQLKDVVWSSFQMTYNIVAAANHEVLAKLFDQALQSRTQEIQKPDIVPLRWTDFDLESSHPSKVLEDKVLYNAVFKFGTRPEVTLLVTLPQYQISGRIRSQLLYPILSTFSDMVSKNILYPEHQSYSLDTTQAIVFVLKRTDVCILREYSLLKDLEGRQQLEGRLYEQQVCFILLQLIHTLKLRQAQGIEEVSTNSQEFLVSQEKTEKHLHLIHLAPECPYEATGFLYQPKPSSVKVSLCQYALSTMLHLLEISNLSDLTVQNHTVPLTRQAVRGFAKVAGMLAQEKAFSLSQAKLLLEFMLWGPVPDFDLGEGQNAGKLLQRWLDTQRAQCLKILAETVTSLPIPRCMSTYEELHVAFLIRANATSLQDQAAMLQIS